MRHWALICFNFLATPRTYFWTMCRPGHGPPEKWAGLKPVRLDKTGVLGARPEPERAENGERADHVLRAGRSLPQAPLGMSEPRRHRGAARGHQRSRRCAPAPQALTTPSSPRSHRSYNPPYAAIVVDANNGAVLHAAAPDAPRHPASLTKIMTLYLLFERLESGKIALDTPDGGVRGSLEPGADQARPAAGRHAQGRGRDQGPCHQVGQRRRGGDRRGARRQRGRVRPRHDAQGPRARHAQHHLPQRQRPAERRADHHRARSGAARHRDPGALPEATTGIFRWRVSSIAATPCATTTTCSARWRASTASRPATPGIPDSIS